MEQSLLSNILAAVENTPEPYRANALHVRVRLLRAKKAVPEGSMAATLPLATGAAAALGAWLSSMAQPGDTVRVEWVDGTSSSMSGSDRKANWTVPFPTTASSRDMPHPTPTANPAPAPAPTATADRPGLPPLTFPSPPAVVDRGAEGAGEIPAGMEAPAYLAAASSSMAAQLQHSQAVHDRTLTLLDRTAARLELLAVEGMSLARVSMGQVGATVQALGVPLANSVGRVSEALSSVTNKNADTAAGAVGNAAELNGHMVARADLAQEARVEAEVRAARGGEAPDAEAPAGGKDPVKMLGAIAELVKEGREAVKGAGKDAAKGAVTELLGELAGDGEIPAEIAAALRSLSGEARGKVMTKLMAAVNG